jgi:hypothetical protein
MASGDDPGLWQLDPTPAQLAALRTTVDTEEPAWFNLTRVM